MRNLVTGATGFIGSFIAERLARGGEEVVALVRRTSDTRFLQTIGARLCYGDINDPESLRAAMKGVDRVYHSAALVDEWISREQAHRVNVEGTRNLLECARRENIKHFVFVSSLAVLGMRDHHGTPSDAPYYKSGDAYVDTKIDAERLALDYHRRFGVPVTVVRPGFVFGPRDKKLIPRIVERLNKGNFMFIGDGKNKMNIVYVDNLVDAVLEAGVNPESIGQSYNVTNDSGIDVENFIFKVADLWHIKKPRKHVPKPLAYLLCYLLGTWATVTKSKKPPYVTKTRIKFLSLNLDFDIGKTKRELRYTPRVGIEEGLEKTKDWLDKI